MNKRRITDAVIIVICAFLSSVIWEFWLEEPVFHFFGYSPDENNPLHWRFVFYETLVIAAFALAYSSSLSQSDKAAALAEKELRLAHFSLESSHDAIFWLSPGGSIRYHNPASESLLGYTAEEFRTLNFLDLKEPPHTGFLETLSREIKDKKSGLVAAKLIKAGGGTVDVEISLAHFTDGSGEEHIFAFVRDVSKRIEIEASLWAEKRKYHLLSEAIYDGFAIVENGLIKEVCKSFTDTLGRDRHELLGKELASFTTPCLESANTLFSPDAPGGRFVIYSQNDGGTRKYFEIYWVPLPHHGAGVLAVALRDVTATRTRDRQLCEMAMRDPLTNLPNRRLLMEHLTHYISMAKRQRFSCALFFIDLDNFKAVNDLVSHKAGDEVLTAIAKQLLLCLRQEDVLARIGGDEFVVLMPNIGGREDSSAVALRLIQCANIGVPLRAGSIDVGASVGIVRFPDQGDAPEQLMTAADAAMYQAKKGGKNRFTFAQ